MPYTAGEQGAAKIADAIGDGPSQIAAGVVTKATSSTTAVVTHGLTGTPDFVLFTIQSDASNKAGIVYAANGTSVTFTKTTAETAWSVAYIAGVTA